MDASAAFETLKALWRQMPTLLLLIIVLGGWYMLSTTNVQLASHDQRLAALDGEVAKTGEEFTRKLGEVGLSMEQRIGELRAATIGELSALRTSTQNIEGWLERVENRLPR